MSSLMRTNPLSQEATVEQYVRTLRRLMLRHGEGIYEPKLRAVRPHPDVAHNIIGPKTSRSLQAPVGDEGSKAHSEISKYSRGACSLELGYIPRAELNEDLNIGNAASLITAQVDRIISKGALGEPSAASVPPQEWPENLQNCSSKSAATEQKGSIPHDGVSKIVDCSQGRQISNVHTQRSRSGRFTKECDTQPYAEHGPGPSRNIFTSTLHQQQNLADFGNLKEPEVQSTVFTLQNPSSNWAQTYDAAAASNFTDNSSLSSSLYEHIPTTSAALGATNNDNLIFLTRDKHDIQIDPALETHFTLSKTSEATRVFLPSNSVQYYQNTQGRITVNSSFSSDAPTDLTHDLTWRTFGAIGNEPPINRRSSQNGVPIDPLIATSSVVVISPWTGHSLEVTNDMAPRKPRTAAVPSTSSKSRKRSTPSNNDSEPESKKTAPRKTRSSQTAVKKVSAKEDNAGQPQATTNYDLNVENDFGQESNGAPQERAETPAKRKSLAPDTTGANLIPNNALTMNLHLPGHGYNSSGTAQENGSTIATRRLVELKENNQSQSLSDAAHHHKQRSVEDQLISSGGSIWHEYRHGNHLTPAMGGYENLNAKNDPKGQSVEYEHSGLVNIFNPNDVSSSSQKFDNHSQFLSLKDTRDLQKQHARQDKSLQAFSSMQNGPSLMQPVSTGRTGSNVVNPGLRNKSSNGTSSALIQSNNQTLTQTDLTANNRAGERWPDFYRTVVCDDGTVYTFTDEELDDFVAALR